MTSVNNFCKAAVRLFDGTCVNNFTSMSAKRMGEVALNVVALALLAGLPGGLALGFGRGLVIAGLTSVVAFAYQTHERSNARKVTDGARSMVEGLISSKDPATNVGMALKEAGKVDVKEEVGFIRETLTSAGNRIKEIFCPSKQKTRRTSREA